MREILIGKSVGKGNLTETENLKLRPLGKSYNQKVTTEYKLKSITWEKNVLGSWLEIKGRVGTGDNALSSFVFEMNNCYNSQCSSNTSLRLSFP